MQKNNLNLRICGVHLLNPYKTVVSHLKRDKTERVQLREVVLNGETLVQPHCSIRVCLSLFTAVWYVVTKGKILSLAFFFCVKADGLAAKLTP